MLNLTELGLKVGAVLLTRRWTISAAESCTGGLFLSTLTDISGSSAYVQGGIVCYSNAVKEQWVGVSAQTLLAYGAVSEPTAREMAAGVRQRFQTDIGMSITGIAGPNGGTPEKPVGLVYIGMATAQGITVARHVWQAERIGNKQHSVAAALQMILAHSELF